jgi:uncharacterized membrane protein
MTIAADLVPGWLSNALGVLMALTCALCLRYADWRALQAVPARYHLVFGGTVACLALWLISVNVIAGLWIHFLGMTALTLILGWRFAVLAGSVAVILHTLIIGQPLGAASPAWLLTVAAPATVSRWLVQRLRHLRASNLFIYMLGAGFGGGLLSVLAVAPLALLLLWLGGQLEWVHLALDNWPLIFLLLFPEGFINGMVVTTLTVFYPDMVKTFDEAHYLGGNRD